MREFLRSISFSNPGRHILVFLDNFRSHTSKATIRFAESLGITLVFLPKYSPNLNPIEFVWKSLRRKVSQVFAKSDGLSRKRYAQASVSLQRRSHLWQDGWKHSVRISPNCYVLNYTVTSILIHFIWERIICLQTGKNKSMHAYQLSDMQPAADRLFNAVFHKTENIALRLPRQIALSQLEDFPPHEIENVYMNFGHLAKKIGITEFRTSQAQ